MDEEWWAGTGWNRRHQDFQSIQRVQTIHPHRQTLLVIKQMASPKVRVSPRSSTMAADSFGKVSTKSFASGPMHATPAPHRRRNSSLRRSMTLAAKGDATQRTYFGRRIPRALMREASVVGLIPSSSAAPPGPYTFQRAWSSAVSTFSRSRPLISASGATVAGGRDSTMAACLGVADGGPE